MQTVRLNEDDLASLSLRLAPLSETWLATLSLATVTQRTRLPSDPTWNCAVNEQYHVLFTQLISDTGLMRDGYYEYLLCIGEKLMVLAWQGEASLLKTGSWKDFPTNVLKALADRGAEIVTYDKACFQWRDG